MTENIYALKETLLSLRAQKRYNELASIANSIVDMIIEDGQPTPKGYIKHDNINK